MARSSSRRCIGGPQQHRVNALVLQFALDPARQSEVHIFFLDRVRDRRASFVAAMRGIDDHHKTRSRRNRRSCGGHRGRGRRRCGRRRSRIGRSRRLRSVRDRDPGAAEMMIVLLPSANAAVIGTVPLIVSCAVPFWSLNIVPVMLGSPSAPYRLRNSPGLRRKTSRKRPGSVATIGFTGAENVSISFGDAPFSISWLNFTVTLPRNNRKELSRKSVCNPTKKGSIAPTLCSGTYPRPLSM